MEEYMYKRTTRKIIPLSINEKDKYLTEGIEFYKSRGLELDDDTIKQRVELIIDKCQNPESYGWKNAPIENFRKRFDILIGKNKSKGDKMAYVTKSVIKQESHLPQIDMSIADEIISVSGKNFTNKQKKLLRDKVRNYQLEFTFNTTSDKQLLKSLIVEELQLSALDDKYLTEPDKWDKNDEEIRKNCNIAILKLQDTLGITRKQRDSEIEKTSKSIAELSISLDEKFKYMKEQEVVDLKEELCLLSIKAAREPINPPLTIEDMQNILAKIEREDLTADETEFLKNSIALPATESIDKVN
jgi:hypothetical protein